MNFSIFHYFPWRQLWVVHHDRLHYKLVHHNCNIFLKFYFSRRNVRHSQVLNVHFVLFIRLVIIMTNHVTCDGPEVTWFSRLNDIRHHKTNLLPLVSWSKPHVWLRHRAKIIFSFRICHTWKCTEKYDKLSKMHQ